MDNWGDSKVREFLLPSEDKVNQSFSETVNTGRKVDVTQMLTLSPSVDLNPECRLDGSNHKQVQQYVGSACSACEVTVKVAYWGTFITALMRDPCM